MASFEDKRNFFQLGIAFARFSAKPDEDEHKIVCTVASRLDLEIPDYNALVVEFFKGGGLVGPPREWLEGPEGESRRHYGRIGVLSFAIFLLAQEDKTISDDAVQELKVLFRAEAIPDDCLNDYLAELKTGDAVGAFREFVVTFSKAVPDDPRSNERIFDNVGSPPSSFDSNVSRTLQLTIAEACSCYKHECYLATIALCGKAIETLLADAFHVLMGKPKPEKMGFAEVRKALRDKGMPLDESMDQLLILIYTHRSVVIHDAGQLQDYEFPKKGLAESVAGLTQEAINIMYDYFSK